MYLKQIITLPNEKIPDWSKLKGFEDDNVKFDENIRMFFKRVENTAGKGEIACYEQFLLFPQCYLNKRAKMALDRSPEFLR